MKAIQEGKGLLSLLREIHLQNHPGVFRPLQLGQSIRNLVVHILQIRSSLVIQGDIALVHPVIEE